MKKITLAVLLIMAVCSTTMLKGQCDSTSLALSVNSINATSGCNGSAIVHVMGGFVPFVYNWSPGGAVTQNLSGLCPGTYTVIVTDSHGCTKIAMAMIDTSSGNPCGSLSVHMNTTPANSGCNGSAMAHGMGGTPGYTYHWSRADSTDNVSGLCL